MLKVFRLKLSELIDFFNPVSHSEKLVSAIGGFVGIFAVAATSTYFLEGQAVPMMIASMGASAVLLFAVPQGKLSQPWALIGGHSISAVVGVTVASFVTNDLVAGATAVSLAILAMHYTECIHPPGGATALVSVIGGPSVHALGYKFVLTPVLLNVAAIFVAALLVNYVIPWRRYPTSLFKIIDQKKDQPKVPQNETYTVPKESLRMALQELNLTFDVEDDDLEKIYSLAMKYTAEKQMKPEEILIGHYYSNGQYGDDWAVRRVIDEGEKGSGQDLIIYRTSAGAGRRKNGVCSRQEFAKWAKYEVYLNENSWMRVDEPVSAS